MYVRLRKNKTGTQTVYLIDSIRVPGKKHACSKVIKCFGSTANQEQLNLWINEANAMKADLLKHKVTSRNITTIRKAQDISSCKVLDLGIKCFYEQIFKSVFSTLKLSPQEKQILKDLVIMRIAMPVSKLRTANCAPSYGIDLDVNKIYRFMDALDDATISLLKKSVFQNTKKLLSNKIRVMFYDLTTIYFEVNSQSELKEFGFSKDGKSQHVQISLALIVTECGMPIGYEVFKGNTFEGFTLISTLNKLRTQYKIDDVTVVADSAMLSEANIKALIENNFKFIIAARVRNMNAKLTKEMLDEKDYDFSADLKYKSINIGAGRRLITAFSDDRHKKDRYDREKALDKIAKLVGKSSKVGFRGALKKPYIKVNNGSTIELDEAKIEASKRLDGYFGFITNTNLSAMEIMTQYKGLWQVEQSFRITKHNLKIRPVYHYKDRRIKAHFAICYLALAMLRTAEYKMRQANVYTPIEILHRQLSEIKEVQVQTANNIAFIATDTPQEITRIFTELNLIHPQRYLSKSRV